MTAPTYDLGPLHGGLRLKANKESATASGLRTMPVPARLVLPLAQHAGDPAEPIIGIGEPVLKGQMIATSTGALSAPVHASTSGRIVAVEPWPIARRQGEPGPCIVIESDDEDRAVSAAAIDYRELSREALIALLLEGGIVGLGGAAFPTAQKLSQAHTVPLEMLILNGVECEPWISCDDLLMRERATAVIGGARMLMAALAVERCCIAVESDKAIARKRLAAALAAAGDERLTLKTVPTIYPSGAEDQLVGLVTRREVPSSGLPIDSGCLVHNVGTAAAVYDWVQNREPLISRITTVTGPGVKRPMNVVTRLGTTVADLVAYAGGYTDRARLLIIGGSMTGRSLSTDRVPIVKASNCVLVLDQPAARGPVLPCIRCGECASVCPIRLLPQQLYRYASVDDEARLRGYGLTDCIECGCCDLVCPSQLALTSTFRFAKGRLRELQDRQARAERARRRFAARGDRLERDAQRQKRELERQKTRAKTLGKDAITAIMRRKRGKPEDPKR